MKKFLSQIKANSIFGLSLFLSGYSVYYYYKKKLSETNNLIKIEQQGIYKSNSEINQDIENTFNEDLILKMEKNKEFNTFININSQEPHSHFYKLKSIAKKNQRNIDFKVIYLDKLTIEQKEKLLKILQVNSLDNLAYIICNSDGFIIPFNKDETNLNMSMIAMLGLNKIESVDSLFQYFANFKEETIFLMTQNKKNRNFEIFLKFFFENYPLSKDQTFNMIELYKYFYLYLNDNDSKDSVFFMFNLKNFLVKRNLKIEEFLNLVKVNKNFFFIDFEKKKKCLKIEEDGLKHLENYSLCYKFRVKDDSNFDEAFDDFLNFVEFLVFQEKNEKNKKFEDFQKLNKNKIFYSNNLDILRQQKIKLFNEKSKALLLFLNENLLQNQNFSLESFLEELNKIFKNNSKNNEEFKILVSINPNALKLFRIIPQENENVTIRFIDFNKLVYFSNKNTKSSPNYSLISLKQANNNNIDLNNYNKNLLFTWKSKYSYQTLNEENLLNFVDDSLQNKNNPYLESFDVYNINEMSVNQNSTIKLLDSNNFDKFLKEKGKKLLFCINESCIGCVKTKQILEDFINQNKDIEVKIYQYDTLNESYLFHKVQNVPSIFLYDNDKITNFIDVKEFIEHNNNDFNNELSKKIKEILQI